MRWLLILLLFGIVIGCNDQAETCPKYWDFDHAQLSAYATADSGKLVLEVLNAVSPNAVQLSQSELQGDFSLSIAVEQMFWDSTITPQLRFEVFSDEDVSGVSVHPNAFYCYVGSTESENRDVRLMHDPTGIMHIQRLGDTLNCTGMFGDVEMSYSKVLHSNALDVRLVFGSTEPADGNIRVVLDDFHSLQDLSGTSDEDLWVESDFFECKTW